LFRRDAKELADRIVPYTVVELGSGNSLALLKKTGEFLKHLRSVQNYISFEMSPDYVNLPGVYVARGHGVTNVLAVQRDFTQPLAADAIASIEALPKTKEGDILLLSLGSSFCNMPCVPEKGFPDKEYTSLFREYAQIGQINPNSNVYLYVSY